MSQTAEMTYRVYQVQESGMECVDSEIELIAMQPSAHPRCEQIDTIQAGSLEGAWDIARDEYEAPLAVE